MDCQNELLALRDSIKDNMRCAVCLADVCNLQILSTNDQLVMYRNLSMLVLNLEHLFVRDAL